MNAEKLQRAQTPAGFAESQENKTVRKKRAKGQWTSFDFRSQSVRLCVDRSPFVCLDIKHILLCWREYQVLSLFTSESPVPVLGQHQKIVVAVRHHLTYH
jgi:hypothetical protein